MAFDLTRTAKLASQNVNIEPQIVLEIDGVPTRYGARVISKRTRIGDDGLLIGDSWRIGGLSPLPNQEDLISLSDTTTAIQQQLDPSKGIGSSISAMQISLIDKNLMATELISPGLVVEDVLARRARVYMGFNDTSFPEDYVTIFRGIIDDVQAKSGTVVLNISHPDQKKRQTLFGKSDRTLSGSITNSDTTLTLSSIDDMYFQGHAGPGEAGIQTLVKIDNEWIELLSRISGTTFNVSRLRLGTTAASHTAGAEVTVMYILKGTVMDLALQLMLSTKSTGMAFESYLEDFKIDSFVYVDSETTVENSMFFIGTDMKERYGITVGDLVYTAFCTNGANQFNVDPVKIVSIENRYNGTQIVVGPSYNGQTVALVNEIGSPALAYFKSQYNVLKVGLGMRPDEVDIEQHNNLKKIFLSSFEVEIYIKDEENIKELIETELYSVAGAYSLPRKSKASVGLHIGPVPGTNISIISKNDVTNAGKLNVRRSIASNFANTIVYKYDQEVDSDDFAKGVITRSEDSINRIEVGTKATVVAARGLRSYLNGQNQAISASNRRLNRYKFAAEYIQNMNVTFKKGFNLEVGDICLVDGEGLLLVNTKDGTRIPEPKLYEIINKSIDLKTGAVSFSLVDTSFSTSLRYGLISPASRIKTGVSNTKFIIEQWETGSDYGISEYLKWSRYVEPGKTVAVKVRSSDFTTRYFQTTIKKIVGNEIEVIDNMGFTPSAGDFMEMADYDLATTTAIQKSIYAYMKNSAFVDGGLQYSML